MNVVYAIRNKKNGKCYVGSTTRLKHRWQDHRRMLEQQRHHAFKLQSAHNKYGLEALEFLVLEIVPRIERLATREQFHLNRLDSFANGYNTLSTTDDTDPVLQRERVRKRWRDPLQRVMQSAVMKKIWSRPGFRKKHLAKLKKAQEKRWAQ